mmetsp:Transcript_1479/g.2264  ORF Transcript_1479/g.2264 Transcript_1479/m.2264 type:complete len:395 (+) Transcript_1479:189-1373(+)
MAVLLIVGTLLYTYDSYKNEPGYVKAGVALIAVGMICFCCGCLACCSAPFASKVQSKKKSSGEIEWDIKRLNNLYENEENTLDYLRMDASSGVAALTAAKKKEKKRKLDMKKKHKKDLENMVKGDISAGLTIAHIKRKHRPCAFKIVFDGDIQVSTIDMLREQISLAIKLGTPGLDQVVVCITSPGGAVTMYGLAASQLMRIKSAGLKLVVCVDSIAASGGYLMGVTADRIYAAPFALVGSIGVISIVPNVHELLEKHDIHTHVITAGKYKRTLDVLGEVTEEGKKKFKEELEEVHVAFKDHIVLNRPQLKGHIEEVSTGEAYLAVQAKQKGLVDEIKTSDEYFGSISSAYDIILLQEKEKKKIFPFDLSDMALAGLRTSLTSAIIKNKNPMLV